VVLGVAIGVDLWQTNLFFQNKIKNILRVVNPNPSEVGQKKPRILIASIVGLI